MGANALIGDDERQDAPDDDRLQPVEEPKREQDSERREQDASTSRTAVGVLTEQDGSCTSRPG